MNLFGLVGMVEALAGPGAFERAVAAADDAVDAMIDREDRTAGRTGYYVPRGAAPSAVALHSARPPRARFCLRRACRSTEAGRVVVSSAPPLMPGLEYMRLKSAWQGRPAKADITYKIVSVEGGES